MKRIATLFLQILILLALYSPAGAACWQWSLTASSNATADPTINWAEGMAPSAVNDSARAMMARLAECRDDWSGKLTTAGTSTAFTLATNEGNIASTPNDGQQLVFKPHVTNGVNATLRVDGGTIFPIRASTANPVGSGVLLAGMPYRVTFNASASAWLLQDFYNSTLANGSVATSMLADNAVTYQKIQKPSTTSRILGTPSLGPITVTGAANNGSGLIRLTVTSTTGLTTGQVKVVSGVTGTTEANGTWTLTVIDGTHVDLQTSAFVNTYVSGGVVGGAVEEITLGTGLAISGNTMVAAPAPPGHFKNLVIKVASNTTATVTADFVTTFNGSTSFRTTAVSCTINFATTGISGLDTGSIASATWYYVWVNVKDDSTTGCTASLQSTANVTFLGNLPATYTHYARVGALRTASGVAQLMGTWQFGRRAQYVVGLAQTSTAQVMASVLSGNIATPTWTSLSVSTFVPATASIIFGHAKSDVTSGSGGSIILAPSNSYGAYNSNTNPPPVMWRNQGASGVEQGVTLPFAFILESTNIFYAADRNPSIVCSGWEDNI